MYDWSIAWSGTGSAETPPLTRDVSVAEKLIEEETSYHINQEQLRKVTELERNYAIIKKMGVVKILRIFREFLKRISGGFRNSGLVE